MSLRDSKEFTVLSFASYKNSEECFMILYKHGSEYNIGKGDKFNSF